MGSPCGPCITLMCKFRSSRWRVGRAALKGAVAITALVLLEARAAGTDDPGERAVQQQQLGRQQQQEQLQLRMQQQQRTVQSPPLGARQQQSVRDAEIGSQREQQQLHYRQQIASPLAQPTDDAATRRARTQMELDRARREGEAQLQRFDSENRRRLDQGRREPGRGEIVPPSADP